MVTLPPSLLMSFPLRYISLGSATKKAVLASKGVVWASILSFSGFRR
uniref:Uncharacterized protein n=1 Tax=Anguilla anguilla TaxID=7936 RepID=A0A0E9W974_ANGAN